MSIRSILLATVLGTVLLAAHAPAGAVSSEEAIETSTTAVQLPRNVGGALMVRQCRSCEQLIVRLEADTRFFINKRQVTLVELGRLIDAGGQHGMTVFYDRGDRTITRVVVHAGNTHRPAGGRS